MMEQQEVQIKKSRWSERTHNGWKQPKMEDGLEYREKYMRRYPGKCDIFFEIEHRLRR